MTDTNDLRIEELLCIAEKAQAQLELEIGDNSSNTRGYCGFLHRIMEVR